METRNVHEDRRVLGRSRTVGMESPEDTECGQVPPGIGEDGPEHETKK